MKSIFKATAILGSSSVINAGLGIVSAKIWAVLLGPTGLGYMSLMQSLLGLAGMIAGVGISTGVINRGAKAIADGDKELVAANQKAAVYLILLLGVIGVLILASFSGVINRVMLNGSGSATEVVLLGGALIFTLLGGLFAGILNSHHDVKALAKLSVVSNLSMSVILLSSVWIWNLQGIVIGIIIGSILNCLISYIFVRREIVKNWIDVSRPQIVESAKSLLIFGLPFTASMLVGTGVQLILPSIISQYLGIESTGYYRAAASISVASLGLILTAMGQDYYPRLSAVADEPDALVEIINQQQFLSIILLSPILLLLLSLSPIVVPLLYSAKFAFTADVLNWMLVGDIFKVLSWTLSFVVLARSRSSVYFCIELFAGATLLITSMLGMQWFGVIGIGISYLATYFLYYLLVLYLMWRQIGFRHSVHNSILIIFTLFSAIVISLLTSFGQERLKYGFAAAACSVSLTITFFALKKHFFSQLFNSKHSE